MAREGEAEILAALCSKGAGIEQESTSREAFPIGELSQPRELASHGNRARQRRRERTSEGARGEEMQQSREGEAAPLRQLCICAPMGEEAIQGEAEPIEEGAKLCREPRSLAELEGSRRSEEHEKRRERRLPL